MFKWFSAHTRGRTYLFLDFCQEVWKFPIILKIQNTYDEVKLTSDSIMCEIRILGIWGLILTVSLGTCLQSGQHWICAVLPSWHMNIHLGTCGEVRISSPESRLISWLSLTTGMQFGFLPSFHLPFQSKYAPIVFIKAQILVTISLSIRCIRMWLNLPLLLEYLSSFLNGQIMNHVFIICVCISILKDEVIGSK